MTEREKSQIKELRTQGLGYKKIAERLGVSENTIKSFCKRNGFGGAMGNQSTKETDTCLYCGAAIKQTPGKKQKKFCSDKCRWGWWNQNLDKVKRKAIYTFECPNCKKQFTSYGNAKRKYCSHQCYIESRFGGEKV